MTDVTEAMIKCMAERFLSWRLPENFNPDAGINFVPDFNVGMQWPMKHQPTGTNLFDYEQAKVMVRHMVEGLPEAARSPADPDDVARVKDALVKADWDGPSSEEYWDYLAAAAIAALLIPATGEFEKALRKAAARLRLASDGHEDKATIRKWSDEALAATKDDDVTEALPAMIKRVDAVYLAMEAAPAAPDGAWAASEALLWKWSERNFDSLPADIIASIRALVEHTTKDDK